MDSAPKDARALLGYTKFGDMEIIDYVEQDGQWYIFGTNEYLAQPTHWMPLPEPPKVEG